MAKIQIDFSEIPSNDIPGGEYEALISQVVVRQAEGKDHPYLNWEFEITDPEYVGRKQWMITPLSPQGAWKTRDQFVALGYSEDFLMEMDYDEETGIIVEPDLSDIPVVISIVENTYQGRTRMQVGTIIESLGDPLGDDEDDYDEDLEDEELDEEEDVELIEEEGLEEDDEVEEDED